MLPPHVSLISLLRESSIDTAELYCFDGCAGRGLSRNRKIAYQALFPAAFLFRFKQRRTLVPQGAQPAERFQERELLAQQAVASFGSDRKM